ncbi:MAG: M48 family metalloprotease [Chitinophagales bacterium]
MKPILTLAGALLCIVGVQAQSSDYIRINNSGALPSEVYTPSTVKYQDDITRIEEELSKKDKKTQQEYYLESGFSIDEMMRSGLVLYNPDYNAYFEKIADELLKNNPTLRNEVHFYLLRSPVVNAFAGAGGNIFISMGLIAMLDNEAELAFVMGHEIGHIALEHGLDFYMEAKEIDKSVNDNSLFRKSSFNESLVIKNLYSQDLETQADSYGADLISKSKYAADTATMNAVFDVLKYSYLPYRNDPFPVRFFEGAHYVISHNLMIDSVAPITGEPEIMDAKDAFKSTHPSIGDRRTAVNNTVSKNDPSGRKEYIVSGEWFLRIRNDARYELPMFYLHNELFQDAIYSAYLSLQKDPDNLYLEKIIAKALTSMTKYRNSKDDEVYAEKANFKEYEGEQQSLYFMLWAMKDVEMNVMSLLYTYNLYKQHPEDKELQPLCKTLINDLVVYHFDSDVYFLKNDSISRDSLYVLSDKNNPKVDISKVRKTGFKKTTTRKTTTRVTKYNPVPKIDKTKAHLLYAFNDFWGDMAFDTLWEAAISERKEREELAKKYKDSGFKFNGADTRNYYLGENLGVDSIVVINPFYMRIDVRKENAIEYISGEEGELNYLQILQDNAQLMDMHVQILDPLLMNEQSVDQFNDMNEFNDWFSVQLDFGSMNIPGYNQEVIDSLADTYGTDYFLWTGIISLRDRMHITGPLILLGTSLFFPPLAILSIYDLLAPRYEFFYLALLYDVKTREAYVLKYELLNNNDTRAILNSHTYEMLYRISAKP